MIIPDETAIPFSRGKLVLLVLIAVGFVLLGLWLFQMSDAELLPNHDPIFVRAIALSCIVFFGACGLVGARKLFDRRPGLQFTSAGVIDNSSGVSAGLIPWSEITGLGVFQFRRSRSIVIKVTDPQKYAAAGGLLRRPLNQANIKLCGSPVVVTSSTLKIGFDELYALFEAYLARYGTAHPVTEKLNSV
jgi:hypothetical protein